MVQRRVRPGSTVVLVLLCVWLSLVAGCARSSLIRRSDVTPNSTAAEQPLPFHQNPDQSTDDTVHPAVPSDGKPGVSTPFPAASHLRTLPAGTLITVRLGNSLAFSQIRAGDAFTASVDGSLSIHGDTVIAAGAPVTGRVEFAQPSVNRPGSSPESGYVGLTLNTVTVNGKVIGLQTSSLFARGTFESNVPLSVASGGNGMATESRGFRIPKGHRLTFRLTAPVTFPDANSLAKR
ncbi:MAG: hypothetical protein WBQ03_04570 [Candidatus Sulfotelmatobacter sp.]